MPNYARLFAEAVTDSVRDYYNQHRDLLIEGYWLIRLRKGAPLIPARTYWCDHAPGEPENKMDRQFLVGEIAGDSADPLDIFAARERVPLMPNLGLAIEQEYKFRCADIQHAKLYRPEDPLAAPRRRVDLARIPPIPPPGAPK